MCRFCVSVVFLLGAMSAAHAFKGECVLQVKGASYLGGPCDIIMEKDGSFQVTTVKGRLYFAYVNLEGDGTANGSWNGTIPGATHAHDNLGTVTRQGACWINEQARICAWKPGTRPR